MSKASRDKKKKKLYEKKGFCESCSQEFPISKLIFGPCPFAHEVYNEIVETVLCEDCYNEACMDV
jgi:hypothetical protein